ncbi:helix-turn-helix domain-containing protein [Aquipuribacter sp. MA13-6]|uniref:helix-turn-helix domain-containing protein n=1 Tax=unclassified Aquipuribacter TaxID=2635084 RepID=UPI003EEB28F4
MSEVPRPVSVVLRRRWHTVPEVADMLGFGVSKTKRLVAEGAIRSVKDGGHRRVLPEWVDEYVERVTRTGHWGAA